MIEIKDIEKLAKLSRIKLSAEEKEKMGAEISSILEYVNQIKEASATVQDEKGTEPVRNIFREDSSPNESGQFTEKILADAPATKDGYLKVKKIIQQDI